MHTQEIAAELIGVNMTTVSHWESQGASPHPTVLPTLERYLGYALAPTSALLGERLRAWRQERGLSFAKAGRQLGTSGATVAKLERGQEVTLRVRMQVEAGMNR